MKKLLLTCSTRKDLIKVSPLVSRIIETPRSKLTRYLNGILSLYAHQGVRNITLEIPRLSLGISPAK